MFRFIALLKILLINSFGFSVLKSKARKSKTAYLKVMGFAALIIIGLAPSFFLYCKLLFQGFNLLAPLGQEGAILSLAIVGVSMMIFIFGIFYLINVFYFAEDAQSLLALPLRPWQVLGARFCVALAYEYLTAVPFLLPPLLIYGVMFANSPLYYIYALLGFLMVPLLPLGLAALPTIIVMRYANLSHRKDLFKILGGLLVIVIAIAYQFIFQKSAANIMDAQYLQHLLTDRNGFIYLISRLFPSGKYLALALVNSNTIMGVLNLIIFAGFSLFTVVLAWLVGEKMYYKGLIGSSESKTKRKKLSSMDYQRMTRGSSPLLSYLRKEIYLLIRTPSYLINCVLTNAMVPLLIFIPFYLQMRNAKDAVPWAALIGNPSGQKILLAVVVGLAVFQSSSNAITATSLSREGKDLYISKYIPLASKHQILAKLLSGYIISIIGVVLIVVAAMLLFPLGTNLVVIILGVAMVAIIPVLEAGLIIDIFHPKLDWENEQKAVKQNLNVLFSMLFAILLGGASIYIVIRFINSLNTAATFMVLCFGLAAGVLYYFLMSRGIEQYDKLEA